MGLEFKLIHRDTREHYRKMQSTSHELWWRQLGKMLKCSEVG